MFKQFLDDHLEGLTPNPDVLCNKEIKFEVFQKYAKKLNAKKIATNATNATKSNKMPHKMFHVIV